jgi:hypothetical protein
MVSRITAEDGMARRQEEMAGLVRSLALPVYGMGRERERPREFLQER